MVENANADPGFRSGEARRFAQTHIPSALARREAGFVTDTASGRATLLTQMRSARGHDFGWVGISLPDGVPLPAPETIRSHIDAMAKTL